MEASTLEVREELDGDLLTSGSDFPNTGLILRMIRDDRGHKVIKITEFYQGYITHLTQQHGP